MTKTLIIYGVLLIVVAILMGFFGWGFQPEIALPFVGKVTPPVRDPQPVSESECLKTATSGLNISEIFLQASSYNNGIDQMDFLGKYKGREINGVGAVEEVNRTGSGFLVDIREKNKQIIACNQDGGEERERELLLLKGKNVCFKGIFTDQRIGDVGLHGLTVDSCILEKR